MKLFLAGLTFFLWALNVQADSDCTATRVRWAEDPLILEGEEIIPLLRPDMISVNEAGECFIDNTGGYEQGTPQIDGEGFAKIEFIDRDGNRSSYDLFGAETMALAICNSIKI